jgi:predicted metal-dependent hydrolase
MMKVIVPEDALPEYSAFWRLWQEGAYFECHEVLEELWRRETGAIKPFYQGLIHCAVALYHARNGNKLGASRQYSKAKVKLQPFAPEYSGVDVNALLQEVENKQDSWRINE